MKSKDQQLLNNMGVSTRELNRFIREQGLGL